MGFNKDCNCIHPLLFLPHENKQHGGNENSCECRFKAFDTKWGNITTYCDEDFSLIAIGCFCVFYL